MASPNAKTVYVVQEMNWEYNDEYHFPAGEPVKAFRDRDRAEAYRRELEQAPRVQDCLSFLLNYAGAYQFDDPLPRMTSLSQAELLERIDGADLPAPQGPPYSWADWYEITWGGLEPKERHRLYDIFDRVRFYQIVEMDLES
jgi:hypothetical protein